MNFDQEKDLITKLLDMPSAPIVLERMISALEEEKLKREQFYADIDDDVKAEFINGEVIIHSPVKMEHSDATGNIYTLVRMYAHTNDLGYVGFEKVLSAFTRNDYEPDVVFFSKEKAQNFKKGMWKFPIPDFVVEVLSKSTEARDRGLKFEDYESHGVKEYWIVDAEKETLEQYVLKHKKYELLLKAKNGIVTSKAIKGLKIEIQAIFDTELCNEAIKKSLG